MHVVVFAVFMFKFILNLLLFGEWNSVPMCLQNKTQQNKFHFTKSKLSTTRIIKFIHFFRQFLCSLQCLCFVALIKCIQFFSFQIQIRCFFCHLIIIHINVVLIDIHRLKGTPFSTLYTYLWHFDIYIYVYIWFELTK